VLGFSSEISLNFHSNISSFSIGREIGREKVLAKIIWQSN